MKLHSALKKDIPAAVLFLAPALYQLAAMEDAIYLRDVLKTMREKDKKGRARTFDIGIRTLNRFSKTGGEYREYKGAREVMHEDKDWDSKEMLLRKPSARKKIKKNPQHHDNKTRNIRTKSGIRKIHIRHIVMFNGKKVLY